MVIARLQYFSRRDLVFKLFESHHYLSFQPLSAVVLFLGEVLDFNPLSTAVLSKNILTAICLNSILNF